MAEFVASDAHAGFQYSSRVHEQETAISGMWLFLATEVLFFGAIIAAWLHCRYSHPAGFMQAAQATDITIGSINTVLLVTSSFVFTMAIAQARRGDARRLRIACAVTFLLGLGFLILKGVEWGEDFSKNLWPGSGFALSSQEGAALFYILYFISTVLHALHMVIGLGLVAWTAWRSRRGWTHPTAVEVVGLYWSFVDIVWMILYPLIYLWGRG
jgi:cytochrome c oxidase subunit III